MMKAHTQYLTFTSKERYEMVHITGKVDGQRAKRFTAKFFSSFGSATGSWLPVTG